MIVLHYSPEENNGHPPLPKMSDLLKQREIQRQEKELRERVDRFLKPIEAPHDVPRRLHTDPKWLPVDEH